jgi:hypothetical protein
MYIFGLEEHGLGVEDKVELESEELIENGVAVGMTDCGCFCFVLV